MMKTTVSEAMKRGVQEALVKLPPIRRQSSGGVLSYPRCPSTGIGVRDPMHPGRCSCVEREVVPLSKC
jgi:hypothetical protein